MLSFFHYLVCSEAYNETEYNYPCSIGCNNQVPFQVKHDDGDDNVRVDGDANDGSQLFSSQDNFISSPHQFISNSFSMMKSFIDSIMNRGSVLVQRSSMAFYLTRNQETGESKLVIVQSEPEVVVHQYHPELMQNLNQNQNQQQNSGIELAIYWFLYFSENLTFELQERRSRILRIKRL